MSNINDIIGRAIADASFRAELLADAAAANTKYDLGLTAEQLEKVSGLDASAIEASLTDGDVDLSAQ